MATPTGDEVEDQSLQEDGENEEIKVGEMSTKSLPFFPRVGDSTRGRITDEDAPLWGTPFMVAC